VKARAWHGKHEVLSFIMIEAFFPATELRHATLYHRKTGL